MRFVTPPPLEMITEMMEVDLRPFSSDLVPPVAVDLRAPSGAPVGCCGTSSVRGGCDTPRTRAPCSRYCSHDTHDNRSGLRSSTTCRARRKSCRDRHWRVRRKLPHRARIDRDRFRHSNTRLRLDFGPPALEQSQAVLQSSSSSNGGARSRGSTARTRAQRREERYFITQNCRGLKTDARLTELVDIIGCRRAFAVCLQETWRAGNEEPLEEDGFTFVGAAPAEQTGRGSRGVAIVLSRSAAAAWREAGTHVWRISSRVIAVRLLVRDPVKRSKQLGVLLVSGYAPVSTAAEAEWTTYYDDIAAAISHRHVGDVLVLGTDANASIGRGSMCGIDVDERTGAVGPYGLAHVNASGRRLRTFLETHELAALSSFFHKPYYGTWLHPRSKCMHQLDQMLVSRSDLFRFTNSGSLRGQLIDSDHRPVGCKLRIAVGQHRKPTDARSQLTRLDFSSLRGPSGASARRTLACSVLRHLGRPLPSPLPTSPPLPSPLTATGSSLQRGHTQIDPSRPSLTLHDSELPMIQSRDDIRDDTWAVVKADYAATLSLLLPPSPDASITYADLAEALKAVAHEELPKKAMRTPGWFAAKAPELRELITERNEALDALHRQPKSAATRALLNDRRTAVKNGVRAAKSAWVEQACEGVSDTTNPKTAWDNVKKLRAGLAPARRAASAKLQKPDGTRAATAEENARVFEASFEKLYGRTPTFDASVLEALPQSPVAVGLDHDPTNDEIRRALARLHDTAPGDSGLPAPLWKALGETAESFSLLVQIVVAFWRSEEMPKEWETGLLAILPKKGDLSQASNYRGIMMLEVCYKIVALLLIERLKPIKEALDHEAQCGFRSGRGGCDGIFTVKQLINKRREHGLETWVLFIDLVKAFDRVPRELLWEVMLKQGVPPKLVSLLKAMHATVNVKFVVDGIESVLASIIGVKQGDVLGPDGFIFYMAAVMATWRSEHSYELCAFRSRRDHVLTGRRSTTGGAADEFTIVDSEYADDTALPFCSRKDVEEQTPKVMTHFARWGMEVHAGVSEPRKESKSEILFCAAPRSSYTDPASYDDADLSDVLLPGGCFMSIVAVFKYLGSYIARHGSDMHEVENRVEAAGKAFGALSSCLFRSDLITQAAKRRVFEGLILAILLFGSECWVLTEKMRQRLRGFHARCLRTMCLVNRKRQWRERISTWELTQQMGLDSMDNYVHRRQLRWLGHVARMSFDRTPRRMLTAWVAAPRPSGGQLMTYGRSIYRALESFGIDRSEWPKLAANRPAWRKAINGELLRAKRPKRAAAAATNRRIEASIADGRAGIWDIDASIAHSLARAALLQPTSNPPRRQ